MCKKIILYLRFCKYWNHWKSLQELFLCNACIYKTARQALAYGIFISYLLFNMLVQQDQG